MRNANFTKIVVVFNPGHHEVNWTMAVVKTRSADCEVRSVVTYNHSGSQPPVEQDCCIEKGQIRGYIENCCLYF